jgi:hypothetical protein
MDTSSSSNDGGGGLITAESIFGLTLTTYRDEWDSPSSSLSGPAVAYFPYECLTAGIAVAFFRMTIKSRPDEPLLLRLFFSATLASMAYLKQPYAMIGAIELFSFIVPYLLLTANVSNVLHRLGWLQPSKQSSSSSSSSSSSASTTTTTTTTAVTTLVRLLLIAMSAMGSLVVSHVLHSDLFVPTLQAWTPTGIQSIVLYMIPIAEMQQAYDTIALFVDRKVLHQQFATLLFVTFHVQFGMGHLGIDFLTREQTRRNDLVRLDMSPESNPDQHQLQQQQQQQQHSKEENDDVNGTATMKTDENDGGLSKKNKSTGNKTENGNTFTAAAAADDDKIHAQSTSSATTTTTTGTTQQQQNHITNETGSSSSSNSNSNSNSSPKNRIQRQLTAAKRFQKSAAPFILFAATPYMLQMIVFGNINFFAYTCFENEVIRAVRLDQVFAHDSHLVALSKDAAATSPNGTYYSCHDYCYSSV